MWALPIAIIARVQGHGARSTMMRLAALAALDYGRAHINHVYRQRASGSLLCIGRGFSQNTCKSSCLPSGGSCSSAESDLQGKCNNFQQLRVSLRHVGGP